jgi:hypothetical protein
LRGCAAELAAGEVEEYGGALLLCHPSRARTLTFPATPDDLVGLLLDSYEELVGLDARSPPDVAYDAADEAAPATFMGGKRDLGIKFSLGPKRSRPASESGRGAATTTTGRDCALDAEGEQHDLITHASVSPVGAASEDLPAAQPWEAQPEAQQPAHAARVASATFEAETGGAARACHARYGAIDLVHSYSPPVSAYAEGAISLVDLPAHVIACVVDQLPPDDELAVALTCRELRSASAQCARSVSGARLTTGIHSLFSSLRKLQWGIACGAGLSPLLCKWAAWSGHLDQLVWLRSIGCPWDETTCKVASACGHLHILQWARQHGCPWNEETCEQAARKGRLNTLAWAHENGCPWNEKTFELAVTDAHRPEILEWLLANHCPHDAGVCEIAAMNGFVDAIAWALDRGFELGTAIACAAQEGQLETLELFLERGIPWDAWRWALTRAVQRGHRAVLEWLLAKGCPMRDDELAAIEPEFAAEIIAVAAAVEAQAAAALAAAPAAAGVAPAAA